MKLGKKAKIRISIIVVAIAIIIAIIATIIVVNLNSASKKETEQTSALEIDEENLVTEDDILEDTDLLLDEELLQNEEKNVISNGNSTNTKTSNTGTTPYKIEVNCEQNVVNIYGKDENGEYTKCIRAMLCSVGPATPRSGTYSLKKYKGWEWKGLFGDVYGQYASQITGNILFHSVPYTEKYNKSSLEYWEYDKLGTAASMGCIRLTVRDVKWIYDNCSTGTKVTFYTDSNPGPLGKPSAQKISSNTPCNGWDPTDPDENNPWRNGGNVENNDKGNNVTNTVTNTENDNVNNIQGNTQTNTQTNTNSTVETNTQINTENGSTTDSGVNMDKGTDTNSTVNTMSNEKQNAML